MTTTTVMTVSRSCVGPRGNTAAIASAADAPQIATAPPVSAPKPASSRALRASSQPLAIVSTTATAVSASTPTPSDWIWPKVMRMPSKATPTRRTVRDANSSPGWHRGSCERKLTAMPSNSAKSMTGAP